MTLIVCLDDKCGMLFNRRRQSRDICVSNRILEITSGNPLYINEYSKNLFPENACFVTDDLFCDLEMKVFAFAECEISENILDRVDRLIIYRWNRCYPSDVTFPMALVNKQFRKINAYEFSGNSHELITEEVYVR